MRSGFTMVELMVVVLILGILAAMASGSFKGSKQAADESYAKTILRTQLARAQAEAMRNHAAFLVWTSGTAVTISRQDGTLVPQYTEHLPSGYSFGINGAWVQSDGTLDQAVTFTLWLPSGSGYWIQIDRSGRIP